MSEPPPADPAPAPQAAAPKRQLTLFDSTCIIVGIIIGAGIYESTPLIASSLPSVRWLVTAWLLGGLFSLLGALCYAELATAYPKQGGDYVYLTRAFGRAPGFLFAWAQLWVVRPGSIGAMAYVFARYANQLCPLSRPLTTWYRTRSAVPVDPKALQDLVTQSERFGESIALIIYAAASITILTMINIVGVREGKWTQNLLTTVKVLGLAAIFVIGMLFSAGDATRPAPADTGNQVESAQTPQPADATSPASEEDSGAKEAQPEKSDWQKFVEFLAAFGFAMIFVLFTYGGWNEMAYVGAEVHNPKKNILRALMLGTVSVTAIYLLVTLAFVHCLGFKGTQGPKTTVAEGVLGVAADNVFHLTERREALRGELAELQVQPAEETSSRREVIESQLAWLDRLARLPASAMCVLIAISALGAVNGMIFTGARIYYAMGHDHRLFAWLARWNSRTQTPVSSLVIQSLITLGLVIGFGWLQMKGHSEGGFGSMVIFTTPVFWFFLLLVGISVAELRSREPDTPRPYRVPGYPVVPVLFCLSSLYMLYSSMVYAVEKESWEVLWSVVLLVIGLAICFCDPRPKGQAVDS